MPDLWVSSLHFAGFGFLCSLTVPLSKHLRHPVFLWLSMAAGVAGLAAAAYLISHETELYERGTDLNTLDWLAAITLVTLALEWVRRTLGWMIPLLIVLAMSYVTWWGQFLSGPFQFPGLSLETVIFRSVYGGDGMFGAIARISWSYVFTFILFGAFLLKSGAGDVIINLARCAARHLVGGPGMVAVLGSGLMGSISGSAVANTVSTGVITIPLMRKGGFSAKFAAGVEAAASTGGQLMPPVMGAGAFIMATYTQVPYAQIIAYGALPALLYFFSVAFFVRVAAKRNHTSDPDDFTPSALDVLRQGWHSLLPIAVLVALLIGDFTPTYAGGIAILSVIAASWLSPSPMTPTAILDALAKGSHNMISTAVLLVAVGLIVNVVTTTGVGNTFSIMISQWSDGNLLLMLALIAMASLILGMGLPVTAAYIVLATLSAPALYQLLAEHQLYNLLLAGELPEAVKGMFMLAVPEAQDWLQGAVSSAQANHLLANLPADLKAIIIQQALPPEWVATALISAHMIIFWLSQDSNVTPPVCLTAFAAAAIANSKPMATGLTAWKVAKGLYIIPILFAFTPLIGGTPSEVISVFLSALVGLYALVGVVEGYLEAPLSWLQRLVLLGASGLLLWPLESVFASLAGLGIVILILILSKRQLTQGELTE